MAFTKETVSGNLGAGGGTRLFTYKTEDARAVVAAAGYFDPANLTFKLGDGLLIQASDGLFQVIVKSADTAAKTVVVETTMSEGGV